MRRVLSVICAAPFAGDMAVCFLLSVLSRLLRWENHHLLCFALTRVPPKVTLLSWCLRLRLLFLHLASVGPRPLKAVRGNTVGMQGGRDSLGRASYCTFDFNWCTGC